jgi:ribosomal protein S18 acetylase RimI-like enzyme
MIKIRKATIDDTESIARLITTAMTDDCCIYFYGPEHTATEFMQFITRLAKATNSQYSYTNTLVAVVNGKIIGAAVSYDGGKLKELRQAFINGMRNYFGKDLRNIPDETGPGEFYLDSFAVNAEYRHQGIGSELINATCKKAIEMGINKIGLLVDTNNPVAEHLYTSLGFKEVGSSSWGGHSMKHMQKDII